MGFAALYPSYGLFRPRSPADRPALSRRATIVTAQLSVQFGLSLRLDIPSQAARQFGDALNSCLIARGNRDTIRRIRIFACPAKPETSPMQTPAWTILAIAVLSACSVARAQTYDPNYPICLQVYQRGGGYIACGFTSMAQCRASASGRAAQCLVNPYYAPARHRKRYIH
jgi:hypothetical protein